MPVDWTTNYINNVCLLFPKVKEKANLQNNIFYYIFSSAGTTYLVLSAWARSFATHLSHICWALCVFTSIRSPKIGYCFRNIFTNSKTIVNETALPFVLKLTNWIHQNSFSSEILPVEGNTCGTFARFVLVFYLCIFTFLLLMSLLKSIVFMPHRFCYWLLSMHRFV